MDRLKQFTLFLTLAALLAPIGLRTINTYREGSRLLSCLVFNNYFRVTGYSSLIVKEELPTYRNWLS